MFGKKKSGDDGSEAAPEEGAAEGNASGNAGGGSKDSKG